MHLVLSYTWNVYGVLRYYLKMDEVSVGFWWKVVGATVKRIVQENLSCGKNRIVIFLFFLFTIWLQRSNGAWFSLWISLACILNSVLFRTASHDIDKFRQDHDLFAFPSKAHRRAAPFSAARQLLINNWQARPQSVTFDLDNVLDNNRKSPPSSSHAIIVR